MARDELKEGSTLAQSWMSDGADGDSSAHLRAWKVALVTLDCVRPVPVG